MNPRDKQSVEADEVAFFDDYYEGHAYNALGWRLRLQRELQSFRRSMGSRRPKRVLSIGCGDGAFERLIAPFVDEVTALDISPEAIRLAQREAAAAGITNIDFRCESLGNLDWNNQFDAVICLAILHHVREEDLAGLLRDVYDHLVPGGFLYSQDPNRHGVLRKLGRIVLGANYDKYHSPDERELDPRALVTQLEHAGFSSVEVRYIDLTLIPGLFLLAKGPNWPLYLGTAIDWAWCHGPFARWASGFVAVARKGDA